MADEYEEFEWKAPKNIWKGVGIYHITFVVTGRRKLLGELVGVQGSGDTTVERSGDMNASLADMNASLADMNASLADMNANEADWKLSVIEKAKMVGVVFTPYGKAVDDMLRHYDEAHEGIKVCKRVVLDDHVHVLEEMRSGEHTRGEEVSGFFEDKKLERIYERYN